MMLNPGGIVRKLKKRLAENRRIPKKIAYPFLGIWIFIAIYLILTSPISSKFKSFVAIKEGLITFDLSGNQHVVNEAELTSINTPLPTPIPLTDEVISLINKEREKNNLSLLNNSVLLNQSASYRIDDMLSKNYWNTTSPDGKDSFSFFTKTGYKYNYAGESLIRNFYTANEIVTALLADKTNKGNILNKNFKDIGITIKDGTLFGQLSKLIVVHYGSLSTYIPPSTTQTNSNSGSRTGKIISYHEYCSNKNISVYQNELITKVSPYDGKTYGMTQGDWDCYYKNNQGKPSIAGFTNTYTPPSNTPNWDPNKEYTNCTVAYINTNQLQHFYITYSECSKRQNEALAKFTEAGKKSLEESQQKIKDQEAASQYQETLNKACTQVESDWYDYKVEFYATEYNNFSSSAEAVKELSRRRDIYQSQANNSGCNIYLTM